MLLRFILILSFSFALVFHQGGITSAQTTAKSKDKLQKDKKKLETEIKETNKLLNQTQKTTKISLNQLVILNSKITIREKLINNISGEIYTLEKLIADNQRVVLSLDNDIRSLKSEYAQMVYNAFKSRNSFNSLSFVLSSNALNQAFKRMQYVQQYSEYRQRQAELILKTQNSLRMKVMELRGQKVEKDQLLTEQQVEKQNLASEKVQKNQYISALKDKEKELLKQKKLKESALAELGRAIERVIQEEIRKRAEKEKERQKQKQREKEKEREKNKAKGTPDKPNTTPLKDEGPEPSPTKLELTPEEQVISNSFIGNKGRLPWPSDRGIITSGFGTHPHPVLKGIMVNNSGIDISTSRGSSARAVYEGKVTGVVNIMGTMAVIIRHGEYLTVYSNLTQVYVKNGDVVKLKQQIGIVNTDDYDDKTELHFEIRKGNIALNPASWISGH